MSKGMTQGIVIVMAILVTSSVAAASTMLVGSSTVDFSSGSESTIDDASSEISDNIDDIRETGEGSVSCIPTKTCADYPGKCGSALSNGCADTLDCSEACGSDEYCNSDSLCEYCTSTCESEGYECGIHTFCGESEHCGDCDSDEYCNSDGMCEYCTSTCESEGYECGTHTVCGEPKDCGTCSGSEVCSVLGKCLTGSALEADIVYPEDGDEFPSGSFIEFQDDVVGGQPEYEYVWSSDKDGVFSEEKSAGLDSLTENSHVITLKVTDSNGDVASDSIELNIVSPDTLTSHISIWETEYTRTETIYFDVDLKGGTAPYEYVWNSDLEGDFSTDEEPYIDLESNPWSMGTHHVTLTVTDSLGNKATDDIDIFISDMTANIYPHDGEHYDYAGTIWFYAYVGGGTAPYEYSWVSDIDGLLGTEYNFERNDLSEGLHEIMLTITDSGSTPVTMTKTFRIQIESPPALAVMIDSPLDDSVYLRGDYISFEGTYEGGILPYLMVWESDQDGTLHYGDDNQVFTMNDLSVGTHTISFTVSDSIGQVAADSKTIVVDPARPLVANIRSPYEDEVFVATEDIIEFNGSATGGVPPYDYMWISDKDKDITPAISNPDHFFTNGLSVNDHYITLEVEDSVGTKATYDVNIQVAEDKSCIAYNEKNEIKYSPKETFLISDTDWRSVLSLVPLSVWNAGGTINRYPALIYHQETSAAFDADSTIHFMQLYSADHLTTIGPIPTDLNNLLVASEPVGSGIEATDISNIKPADYFSYWESFNSIVVVDFDNYKAGLMASVFASEKNSPLVFVNSVNLDTYKTLMNGKVIYTVGKLDKETQGYIDSNCACKVSYTLEELQKWYAVETGTDKLIMVNPNDLEFSLSPIYSVFYTEKSNPISYVFGKSSLAAPFLAASRQELIAYTELPDTGNNKYCSENTAIKTNIALADIDTANAINTFFVVPPKYLTVIAAPNAIPDSVYSGCHDSYQFRTPVDWKYGSLDDINLDLYTGRIYGVTISDISSYIFRSVFFDQIISDTYGSNYNGMSIGHSFDSLEEDTETIKKKTSSSGYNSICFVSDAGYSCTVDAIPELSNYEDKRYITFSDHGAPSAWSSTLSSTKIPWLDLSYSSSEACLTNNYWQGGEYTFGVNMLRKGAIGYRGSAGVAYLDGTVNSRNLRKLTGADYGTITLGESHGKDDYYMLLGDPTLQPRLKQVTW